MTSYQLRNDDQITQYIQEGWQNLVHKITTEKLKLVLNVNYITCYKVNKYKHVQK